MNATSKIMEFLHERGITQTFVADRAGMGLSKLNLALNGRRKLTLEEYEHVCWALGVGVDTFLCPGPPAEEEL